jgi:hypothetical protein
MMIPNATRDTVGEESFLIGNETDSNRLKT